MERRMNRLIKKYLHSYILIIIMIISVTFSIAKAEEVPLIQELPDEAEPVTQSHENSKYSEPAYTEPVMRKKKGIGIGFGFGFNYILAFDSRFSGYGNQFILEFPLSEDISVGIFHESTSYSGQDTDGTNSSSSSNNLVNCNVDSNMNTLRIKKEIIPLASAFIGIGSASVSGCFSDSSIVTDIGVKVTPLASLIPAGKTFSTIIGADLAYRYLGVDTNYRFNNSKSDYVKSLSGFTIGINFSLQF
jgi:hypothetical protein